MDLAKQVAAFANKLRFGITEDETTSKATGKKQSIAEVIAAYANKYRQAKQNRRG
ncbi:hypothetical protein Desku_3520 [Desulfofundulus kuznetsovii DSM 6115]|jgi:hypothetical protein|uniref:Uncharacterized protein n=1 Tax=Desulfofundulus kuznetsovii (strain DSM 6115 / VKM B-1805 / 17) TaxID=760568 RepID=A0AAU8PFS7_DESK7|nr:hypothetical protein Desku_1410 [Desulfofundulus kuznetsovii DSM 6115]AEG16996.1 hypothetical protein Desku_3520 [Desulfofundulus kuznetsovii DSM 6115]